MKICCRHPLKQSAVSSCYLVVINVRCFFYSDLKILKIMSPFYFFFVCEVFNHIIFFFLMPFSNHIWDSLIFLYVFYAKKKFFLNAKVEYHFNLIFFLCEKKKIIQETTLDTTLYNMDERKILSETFFFIWLSSV